MNQGDGLTNGSDLWDALSFFDKPNQSTPIGFDVEKDSNFFFDITPWEQESASKETIDTDTKKSKNKINKLNVSVDKCANIDKPAGSSTGNKQKEDREIQANADTRKVAKKSKGKKRDRRLRSRFGCEKCRNKRVKCDEKRPLCGRCLMRGVQCKYKILLQFREDYENKGKKFGREGVWNKTGLFEKTVKELVSSSKDTHYLDIQNTSALAFVNFTIKDIVQGRRWIPPSIQPSLIPVDIRTSANDNLIGFALNYYIDVISPIFNPVGFKGFNKQYIINMSSKQVLIEPGLNSKWLIQYSQNRNSVFYLVLALGFLYLSKNNTHSLDLKDSRSKWFTSSLVFKHKGMQMISEKMSRFQTTPKSNLHLSTEFLLSLVLLMLYEVADNCNEKWGSYLKICKNVICSEYFEQPKNDIEAYLLQFSLELLNYQETMGRTACKDKNSFFLLHEDDDEEEQAPTLYSPSPTCVRISWMGCDRNLVNVISDITDLSFERFNNICLEDYTILSNELKNRLITMDLGVNIDDYLLDAPVTDFSNISASGSNSVYIDLTLDIEDFCFLLSCEVKRLAGLIYWECCLLNAKPEDRYIQTMLIKAYKILTFIIIQNDFKWISTLLWSLFIVSAEISVQSNDCDTLRYLTLKMLNRIQPKSLGNVDMIREIILGIWKGRDIRNCDENSFGYTKKPGIVNERVSILGSRNDWEIFVANESYKISLA